MICSICHFKYCGECGNCGCDKWISVKDKLPTSPGHYLVVADWMGVIEKGEFDGKNQWYTPHSVLTHWMPLPMPPEVNNE